MKTTGSTISIHPLRPCIVVAMNQDDVSWLTT